jgi:hypothetical protein
MSCPSTRPSPTRLQILLEPCGMELPMPMEEPACRSGRVERRGGCRAYRFCISRSGRKQRSAEDMVSSRSRGAVMIIVLPAKRAPASLGAAFAAIRQRVRFDQRRRTCRLSLATSGNTNYQGSVGERVSTLSGRVAEDYPTPDAYNGQAVNYAQYDSATCAASAMESHGAASA